MNDDKTKRIVLLAGPVRARGPAGHHDYFAGCRLLADILARVDGIEAVVVDNGWPADERVLEHAAAVVIYDGGNGKQAFIGQTSRVDTLRGLLERGVGLVVLHQAVAFPPAYRPLSDQWLGASYVPGQSRRGHWRGVHAAFPTHPVTRGVTAWRRRDGWLNGFELTADRRRITPLLWSGRRARGSNASAADARIVAWLYARADGGQSFVFTGLDNHRALRDDGLRRLLANSILFVAGRAPPQDDDGAASWTAMDRTRITGYMTPRRSWLVQKLGKLIRPRRRRFRW